VPAPIERIDDPADPRLADYRDLKEPRLRRERGIFIAESREVVRQLLGSGRFRTRSILVTPPGLDGLRDVLDGAGPAIQVFLVRPDLVRAIAGFNFHRGCLAVGERGVEPALSSLVDPPGRRLLLVLEGVSNPDNIGAVFRNAMAFGADAVLLSPACADPLYRKAIRVSIGGSLRVPFARVEDWPAGLGALRASGYTVIALTPRAPVDLAELGAPRSVPERVAVLLGAEGAGLSAGASAAAERAVRIAMAAGVDSLNIATACGIALHRLRGSRA